MVTRTLGQRTWPNAHSGRAKRAHSDSVRARGTRGRARVHDGVGEQDAGDDAPRGAGRARKREGRDETVSAAVAV